MGWGAIVGAGISVAGSLFGKKKTDKAASDAGKYQAEVDKARLDFDKQRYQDWEATYGPLEDNLAEYYKTLSPTLRTVQGLAAYEKERDFNMTSLRENLAQRGLATSGITAQVETYDAVESAKERAKIRADAPMETAKEKASFLSIGLGHNPADKLSETYGDIALQAGRTTAATASAAGRATANAWESGANLAEGLVNIFANK